MIHRAPITGVARPRRWAIKSAAIPATAPRRRPARRESILFERRKRTKSKAPATIPTTSAMPMAIVCSAAFAAVSVPVRPTARIAFTMVSMPNVIKPPGRIRVVQSKTSNGTNARPKKRAARKNRAMSGAVKNAPTKAPDAAPGFSAPLLLLSGAMRSDPQMIGRGRARESALLNDPCVAVRVGEVDEAGVASPLGVDSWRAVPLPPVCGRLVANGADGHAAFGQFAVCGLDVGHDEVGGASRSWGRVGETDAELHRAR